jgi:pentatricopeptide repeat protein
MINSDLVLDSTVFNVILNFAAKKITASRRSEECVAFMAEVLDDMKSNGIEMDNYTLNTALEIYHKCGKDGDEMLKLLQEMYVSASLISYNIILKNLCQQDRMEEAHTFLQNMVTNYIKDNQSIKPTVAAFNSLLNYDHDPLTNPDRISDSNLIHDTATRAIQLLDQVEAEFDQKGYKSLKPDSTLYNIVINAIATSRRPNKAEEALKIVQRITTRADCRVTSNALNGVLNACAHSNNTNANELKERFKTYRIPPNQITFMMLFKTCVNLSDYSHKKKYIFTLFRERCVQGLVNERIVNEVCGG